VARSASISVTELSRIERGLAPWASLLVLAQLCAIVGLDLAARAYPGGAPIRDARHAALLEKFHSLLHPDLSWASEVPLPIPGDHRAWDGLVRGSGWRYGAEAELNPADGQALLRRLNLKIRDGGVDGVILLLRDTRQSRQLRRELHAELAAHFPVPGRRTVKLLGGGFDPGGSSIVVL
jgi:hypothetical protein